MISIQDILDHKGFQKSLHQYANQSGSNYERVLSEATEYVNELYAEHQPLLEAFLIQGFDYLLSRGYDRTIDVDPDELKSLTKTIRKYPVAFVMTHKTYIDMIVLGLVLARHGLPIPYTFAGINMAFMGMAELGRKCGVLFIRRNIKDNELYRLTLKHFIACLVSDHSHFMWALEGTRSRTGKLVWPKMGILKYIVEGEDQSDLEVKYIPVTTVYDLIPDVLEMTKEGRGKDKRPETLLWFLKYLKDIGNKHGKISLRFGDPVVMDQSFKASLPEEETHLSTPTKSIPRFAFELMHSINRVTPVTTTSLICTCLLSKFSLKKKHLEHDVSELMKLVESHKSDALVDRGNSIGESIQHGLNLLIQSGIVQFIGEGLSARYAIVAEKYLSAIYYSNMAVHHLYHRAFIELALIGIQAHDDTSRETLFWEEIFELRKLFKFEFFYSNKPLFTDEIEAELNHLSPNWPEIISGSKEEIRHLLNDQQVFVSHVVLFSYIESYRVVARTLLSLSEGNSPLKPRVLSDKNLLKECLFYGEEMHWLGQIQRIDSVSKPFLINGIRLASNLGLYDDQGHVNEEKIREVLRYLEDLSFRIKDLQNNVIDLPAHDENVVPFDRYVVPGSKTATITDLIVQEENGAHIAAFFDLDRTLIRGFSAKNFFQERLLSGRMKPRELVAQFAGVLVYAVGNNNFAGLAAIGAKGVKGIKEDVFIEVGEEVYLNHLADEIYPESRALVAAHLAKGHTVAIVSAATPYQVRPIARDLNIQHVMCTQMEVKDGTFTGEIVQPACWGDGKAFAANEFAKKHAIDLSKSYFYTDSAEDLPLLEIVGHPQPINPDTELSSIAYQNDWTIYRFNDENRPKMSNLVRTGLAFGSLIPAAIGGLASGLLSQSKSDGINSMMSLVGDIGTKVAGIELVVKNKEHLWTHRPAVFLFNHQSNVDFFIVAKLVRQNAVAIAKKELEKSPVGPLFKLGGVIFIDRTDREKAINAMQPAIEGLQNGTSVVIAPEGTRSYDYTLGPFKKGAFHLAMQANVPIVPIVIKNAHDVMPRGAALLKPSVVEVKILDPISTKGWDKKSLTDEIAKIRKAYLKELGQL